MATGRDGAACGASAADEDGEDGAVALIAGAGSEE
jgi:hypothetical protein